MTVSLFPTQLDIFSTKTDGVDRVLADHVNYLQSAAAAIQAAVANPAWVGFAYNYQNPKYGGKGDGTDETSTMQAFYTAVPAGQVLFFATPTVNYLISGTMTPKNNHVSRGANRLAGSIRRANNTNLKMFAGEGKTGLVFESLGIDPNGANQSSNTEAIRLDNTSNNALVRDCNFPNAQGFVIFAFGGPQSRCTNLRVLENDVTTNVGSFTDVIVPLSSGGETTGNRVNGQGQVCFNVYEADNHPVADNHVVLNGAGGTGYTFSSTNGCPGVGNSAFLGGGDTGFGVNRETDNLPTARENIGQALSANHITGGAPGSIAYQVGIPAVPLARASSIHINGGSVKNVGYFVQFGASVVGVTIGDVEIINVLNPWTGTPAPFTWIHHCPGLSPFGKLAVAVGASGVDFTDTNLCDAVYYFAGGTVTGLNVGFKPPIILFITSTSTGGTLAGGATYGYRITFVDNAGGESMPGPEVTIAVPAGTNTNAVTITWFQPSMALRSGFGCSFKVYGRTAGAELQLATIGSNPVNAYTDTGSATPSGALPTSNGTARATGMLSGPIYVGAFQTIQWTGSVAPTATAWGLN